MQPLNHDMDELMRQAAADYPVKPQGMDWEKVAQQLTSAETKAAAGNRYGDLKKLLLLVPFVLASFICDRFFIYGHRDMKKLETAKQITTADPGIYSVHVMKQIASATRTQRIENAIQQLTTEAQKNGVTKPIIQNSAVLNTTSLLKEKNNLELVSTPQTYKQANLLTTIQPALKNRLATPLGRSLTNIAIAKTPTVKKNNRTGKANPIEKFSVSLLFGPDYSQVKGQRTMPAGYSVGALAAYHFNKRWAVETGVLWDRKNYYSKGQYFKTDKIKIPDSIKVLQVDGYCAMYEIPVNVRFTALEKAGNTLFLSGGLSSYLMRNEDYNFEAKSRYSYFDGNANYKHASKDWMSIANLSVGYERQLGSKIKLRLEPYVKVPLKGVGIGSLPLSSAGVLVGVTYPFH